MTSGISSFTRLLLIFCAVTYVAGQYTVDSTSVPKKSLQNPPRRFKTQSARFSGTPTTILTNPRHRKPIAVSKPISRTSEPIPELPVFTSGIRGSNKGPFAPSIPLAYEQQNDDASAQPIHHQQSYHPPAALQDVKPVSEEQEKDEDVVQVISNIGNSYPSYTLGNHLLSSTASPIYSTTGALPIAGAFPQIHPLDAIQYRPAPHFQSSRPIGTQSPVSSTTTTTTTQVVPTIVSPQPQLLRQQQHQQQHQQHHQQHHQQQQQLVQAQYSRQPQKPSKSHHHHHQKATLAPPAERNEFDEPSDAGRHIAKARAQLTPKKAKQEYYEGGAGRSKKPVAQVIRRYREETADGSIIWGFENDDGSFKEEIIGIDCITRGKYGYVDPDGVRREYTYETGIKCDEEAQHQDQDILNTFVDYQENKLVLPSGKTIDLSSMGKKQARRPNLYRN